MLNFIFYYYSPSNEQGITVQGGEVLVPTWTISFPPLAHSLRKFLAVLLLFLRGFSWFLLNVFININLLRLLLIARDRLISITWELFMKLISSWAYEVN